MRVGHECVVQHVEGGVTATYVYVSKYVRLNFIIILLYST